MNNTNYNSEIEGMRDFYEELLKYNSSKNYQIDYSCNTDGKINGTLFEFKLVFKDIKKHREQIQRYIKAFNSSGINPPKFTYLISLNEKKYIKYDNSTGLAIEEAIYVDSRNFEIHDEVIDGWIDEFSIISWNNRFCDLYKKATKEEVKNEFINPKVLKIKPFDWDDQIKKEKENRHNNNWLTFNMNLLGNSLLKRRLGAFFTPDVYVHESTKMVREAIKLVPEGNDYIILDRCAGTGNLEKFLTSEELEHVVLNTYDYTEWTTLQGIFGGRVKMIIPPTNSQRNQNGLLENGDAFSEQFFNYKPLRDLIENPKITIIMLENPPFAEPAAEAIKGNETTTIKEFWLRQKIQDDLKEDEEFSKINGNKRKTWFNDLSNIFIYSAFKYYLRQPTDSYIVFSPIKYWKQQHIIDKKVLSAFLCDRANFNAQSYAVSLIHWKNENDKNDTIKFKLNDNRYINLNEFEVHKVNSDIHSLFDKNEKNSSSHEFTIYLKNGIPDFKLGRLANYPLPNMRSVEYKLNIFEGYNKLPFWVANEYKPKDFYEKGTIIKSGDGGIDFTDDKDFLKSCFVYALFSKNNQCLSDDKINNPFAIYQHGTSSDIKWNELMEQNMLNEQDKNLEKIWRQILGLIKDKYEYNPSYNYGVYQINRDINIKQDSGSKEKTGKPIMIPKYAKLDEELSNLNEKVKQYYEDHIKNKLFKYGLLK